MTVGDGAYVAAGSTITSDVGPGELAVARGKQRGIAGWVARRRAGTKYGRGGRASAWRTSRQQTQQTDQQDDQERSGG